MGVNVAEKEEEKRHRGPDVADHLVPPMVAVTDIVGLRNGTSADRNVRHRLDPFG